MPKLNEKKENWL